MIPSTTDPRAMEAGEELDRRIAVEVFGWDEQTVSADGDLHYSSDPAASAELRAKLWGMGFNIDIHLMQGPKSITVSLNGDDATEDFWTAHGKVTGDDPRPAECLAVARAGLDAVRKKGAANG